MQVLPTVHHMQWHQCFAPHYLKLSCFYSLMIHMQTHVQHAGHAGRDGDSGRLTVGQCARPMQNQPFEACLSMHDNLHAQFAFPVPVCYGSVLDAALLRCWCSAQGTAPLLGIPTGHPTFHHTLCSDMSPQCSCKFCPDAGNQEKLNKPRMAFASLEAVQPATVLLPCIQDAWMLPASIGIARGCSVRFTGIVSCSLSWRCRRI